MYCNAIRLISLALKPTARAALIGLACSLGGPALGQPLMRFPTVSATAIAFVAYGNLWAVARRGGAPKRLTDDPGQILMPHFSPDGRSLAFFWVREGGSDVYVMPAGGGTPTRLTHGPTLDSYDNVVIQTMGEVLAGSDRPLIFTSGTGMGSAGPGRIATEDVFDVDHPNSRTLSELTGAEMAERASVLPLYACRRFTTR